MKKPHLLSFIMALLSFAATPVLASGPACDPEFMKTLRARGWMEAQREIMANETLIYKPDSVFALSCFGSALNRAASINSFYESSGTAKAQAEAQMNAILGGAFSHGYLGATSGSQSATDCSRMLTLWRQAKCENIATNEFDKMKFPMDEIRTNNTSTCSNATWTASVDRVKAIGASAPFDSVKLFLNVTDPLSALSGSSGSSSQCAAGIPTGVTIGISNGYAEIVCPNPGCVPKDQNGTMECKPQ